MEKTLRYALVGCGSFGGVHLDVLTRLAGTKIVALCDIHPESCERLRERFGLDVPCYTDYREMLAAERENIDIVDVVTS
ncbi:MAG: Gfo/Idh/MocA family oxidoreductase, partial [Clostridia bacterium]|nr:Gfo/Idh/MocA family oxidoreductase [Clostridia bacterium]